MAERKAPSDLENELDGLKNLSITHTTSEPDGDCAALPEEGAANPQVDPMSLFMATIYMGTSVKKGGSDKGGTPIRRGRVWEYIGREPDVGTRPHIVFGQKLAATRRVNWLYANGYAYTGGTSCGLAYRQDTINLVQEIDITPFQHSDRIWAAVLRYGAIELQLLCVSWNGLFHGGTEVQSEAFNALQTFVETMVVSSKCSAVVIAGNFYLNATETQHLREGRFESVGPDNNEDYFLHSGLRNTLVEDPTWIWGRYMAENFLADTPGFLVRAPILAKFRCAPLEEQNAGETPRDDIPSAE